MRLLTLISAAALSFAALPCLAQEPVVSPAPATPAAPAGRTVLRLDLAAVLFSNLDNNFTGYRGTMLPLMVSAERQLPGRASVVGEVLLGGGSSYERRWGLGAQGRYYLGHKPLTGLYVAPVLSLRATSTTYRTTRWFGGAGMMLGAQLPVACQRRLLLDASAGVMAWGGLSGGKEARQLQAYGYETPAGYALHPVMADMRLGLGWRF